MTLSVIFGYRINARFLSLQEINFTVDGGYNIQPSVRLSAPKEWSEVGLRLTSIRIVNSDRTAVIKYYKYFT